MLDWTSYSNSLLDGTVYRGMANLQVENNVVFTAPETLSMASTGHIYLRKASAVGGTTSVVEDFNLANKTHRARAACSRSTTAP